MKIKEIIFSCPKCERKVIQEPDSKNFEVISSPEHFCIKDGLMMRREIIYEEKD